MQSSAAIHYFFRRVGSLHVGYQTGVNEAYIIISPEKMYLFFNVFGFKAVSIFVNLRYRKEPANI